MAAVGIAPQARTPLHLFFYQYYFRNGFITAMAEKALSQFFSKAIYSKEMLYQSSEPHISVSNTSRFNSL